MRINAPKEVLKISEIFKNNGYKMLLVGGCVRDSIMGEKPHDWDLCTDATPDEILDICKKNNIKFIPTGLKHGTITAILNSEPFEITTFRIDGDYSDSRRPDSVEFSKDINEDLSRRDFTINAIAIDPISNDIVDPFDGIKDIENGIIRAVGNADNRIKEDGLRILRALRFSIKFGFDIDEELKQAILRNKDILEIGGTISRERVTDEFKKIFSYRKPICKIFTEYRDIISVIIPEIERCFDFEQTNKHHIHDVYTHILYVTDYCKTDIFEIKMAAFLHDIGKPDCFTIDEKGNGHFYGHPDISHELARNILNNSFRVSNAEKSKILKLVKLHDLNLAPTKKALKRVIQKNGNDFLEDWFILKQADIDDHIFPNGLEKWGDISETKILYEELKEDLKQMTVKDLAIDGRDIMKILNIKPCKKIGEILNTLLEKVLNEELENDKEALIEEIKRM